MVPRIELSVRSVGWTRGGPLSKTVRETSGGKLSGRKRVLLLVHGYNNDEGDARDAYEALLSDVGTLVDRAFDCVVEFQWPGDSYLRKLIGAAEYPLQINTARQAAGLLFGALRQAAVDSNGGLRLSIVAHSLGCRLILEAISQETLSVGTGPRFDLVLMMAAAVPVDLVRTGHLRYGLLKGQKRADEIAVLHSQADTVLQWAFPLGQRLAWRFGIERAWYREAVGRWGEPFRLDRGVTPVSTGYRHGGYWSGRTTAWVLAHRIGAAASHPTPAASLSTYSLEPGDPMPPHRLVHHRLGGM